MHVCRWHGVGWPVPARGARTTPPPMPPAARRLPTGLLPKSSVVATRWRHSTAGTWIPIAKRLARAFTLGWQAAIRRGTTRPTGAQSQPGRGASIVAWITWSLGLEWTRAASRQWATGGTIAAWAWGFHRCVDYLVSEPGVDAHRIAAVGHSRNGKTALLAAAFDERIAIAFPHQAGCGGSAPSQIGRAHV